MRQKQDQIDENVMQYFITLLVPKTDSAPRLDVFIQGHWKNESRGWATVASHAPTDVFESRYLRLRPASILGDEEQ
jgi:hypothetical protein